MPDSDYHDDQFVVMNFINNTVVTDTYAPGISAWELYRACRPWIVRQFADGLNNAVSIRLGNTRQIFLSGA